MYKFQALKPRARLLPIVSSRKHGFTLLELLVSIAIVGILASILLVAMSRVQLEAKKKRTQQQVNKIDHLLRPLVNDVLNRPLKIQFSTPLPPRPQKPKRNQFASQSTYDDALAQYNVNLGLYMNVVRNRRLQILTFRRELMRLEIPDRMTDVLDSTYVFRDARQLPNSRNQQYLAAILNNKDAFGNPLVWSAQYQDSECLYLILSTLNDRNISALDFLLPSEIGDLDEDGMPELLDAFGNPLGFLLWAPGLSARVGPDGKWGLPDIDDDGNGIIDDAGEHGMGVYNDDYRSFSAIQSHNPFLSPDWTDVAGIDPRLTNANASDDTFNLLPLICSAGQDGTFGVFGLRADGDRIPERGQTFPRLNDYLDSFSYQSPNLIYDPFVSHEFTDELGVPYQFGAFVALEDFSKYYLDNISNHDIQETQ